MAATSFSLADLEYAYYKGATDGSGNFTALPVTSTSAAPITSAPYDVDGQSVSGSVAAPGAAAPIATLSLTTGTWDVTVQTYVGGTSAPLDTFNMELRSGATPLNNVISPTATSAGPDSTSVRRVKRATTGNVSINATAAASAGTTYYAVISAARVR